MTAQGPSRQRRPLIIRQTVRLAAVVIFAILPIGLSFGLDRNEPVAPLPTHDLSDPTKVDLGRSLFFDPLLSSTGNVSCATCHDLEAGGTIRVKRAIGFADGRELFNVPTVFNVSNNRNFGWRGLMKTLNAQNEKVLLDPNLMATTWQELIPRLQNSPRYARDFQMAYGLPPNRETVLDALASFEISLRTPDAPFDRFLRGDVAALSADAARGYRLFKDYGCVSCHQGSNIGGNMVQRLGLFVDDNMNSSDAGSENNEGTFDGDEPEGSSDRDAFMGSAADEFRVPSLRNVAVTAPYFHDGRTETLPQAVSLMGRLQLGRELTDPDVAAITAFLESLTGQFAERSLDAPPPSSTDPTSVRRLSLTPDGEQ